MRAVSAVLAALALILGGCAQPRVELPTAPPLKVVVTPTRPITVVAVQVERQGEDLVVTGKVRSPHRMLLPGTVDLVVCGTDGSRLAQARPVVTDHASRRGGAQTARFSAKLPGAMRPDAVLQVRYLGAGAQEPEVICR
ncbi:MAG: hypothetical protein ACYDAI_08850 [Trichloromonadaceae bacterium]